LSNLLSPEFSASGCIMYGYLQPLYFATRNWSNTGRAQSQTNDKCA